MRFLSVLLLSAVSLFAREASAQKGCPSEGESYSYEVLLGDSSIGEYTFQVWDADEKKHICVAFRAHIKIFLVNAKIHYDSMSVYTGNTLNQHDSFFKVDDKVTSVSYSNGHALHVNDNKKRFAHNLFSLQPFMLPRDEMISLVTEDGKVYEVQYEIKDQEEIVVGGKTYLAQRVKVHGRVFVRHLWYDDKGVLLKVKFRKKFKKIRLMRIHR